jgi:hypothetical protein
LQGSPLELARRPNVCVALLGVCVRSVLVAILLYSLAVAGFAPGRERPLAAATQVSSAAEFDTLIKPFLAAHCYACHGNRSQQEGLNLQAF